MANRQKYIVTVFAFVLLLIALVLWVSSRPVPAATSLSVGFVGMTNGPARQMTPHNPARSHFAGFLNSILLRQAGTGKADVIPLKAALHSAQTSKTSLIEGFQLPPGATVRFAVPTPNAHGTWQCLLSLNRVFLYKTHPWQTETVMFAQRFGIHFGEKGQLVSSRQITQ